MKNLLDSGGVIHVAREPHFRDLEDVFPGLTACGLRFFTGDDAWRAEYGKNAIAGEPSSDNPTCMGCLGSTL